VNRTLTLTPAAGQSGTSLITVSVTDGVWTNSRSFLLTVGSVSNGPIAHWKLDEAAGTVASDSSGNGYTGTIKNGAIWAGDATRSSYLSFDGINDRVETLFQVDLTSTTKDFTWAVWVNSQAAPTNGVIIGNRKPDLNSQLNFLKLTSKQVNYAGGGTQQNYDFNDMVQNEWHHHAVVKSGTNLLYYRDGAFVGTRAITKLPDGPFPFYMGGDPAGSTSEHFKGFIDDVVLYAGALSEVCRRTIGGSGG